MPQVRDSQLRGIKLGIYKDDKAAGRVRLEKGEKQRILLIKDRWNPATGEKMESPLEIVTSKAMVEKQVEGLEKKMEDAQELLADIDALG